MIFATNELSGDEAERRDLYEKENLDLVFAQTVSEVRFNRLDQTIKNRVLARDLADTPSRVARC